MCFPSNSVTLGDGSGTEMQAEIPPRPFGEDGVSWWENVKDPALWGNATTSDRVGNLVLLLAAVLYYFRRIN